MGLLLAEAPFEEFARDNSPILGVIILLILAILIVRLIHRTVTRLVMLAFVVLVGLFLVVERDAITECTQTCECELVGQDVDIPYCNRKLPRTGV